MTGPLIIGAAMTRFGADAFFAYIGIALRADRALCALAHDPTRPRRRRDLVLCAGAAAGLAGGARGGAGRRDRARRRGRGARVSASLLPHALGEDCRKTRGGNDGRRRPRSSCDFWLDDVGAGRLVPQSTTRSTTRIREPLAARSGRRRAPAGSTDWRCDAASCAGAAHPARPVPAQHVPRRRPRLRQRRAGAARSPRTRSCAAATSACRCPSGSSSTCR